MAAHDPQQPERAVLASVKHNLSATAPSIGYVIESVTVTEAGATFATSRLAWGERSALRADDLAAPLALDGTGGRGEAEAFLREFLLDGPRWVQDVKHEAEQRGMSFGGAVRRASEQLGVIKRQNQDGELPGAPPKSRYIWLLP